MIENRLYHVKKPDEHDEPDVARNQTATTPGSPPTVMGMFVGGRYAFYHHVGDFLRIINSHHLTKSDVDKILRLTGMIRLELDKRVSQIVQGAYPTEMEIVVGDLPVTSEELRGMQSNPTLASFAVSVLSMLTAKPYAIMYGPLRHQGLLPYLKEKDPE